ncbi:MAG: DUF349 domain-containing protein, partial [Bacteroidales bacterium]|nr:DUF349 domain-containing protein [Bacteroidales bacterium]
KVEEAPEESEIVDPCVKDEEAKSQEKEEINYDDLSSQDLVEILENLVAEEDITKIKTKVALLKVAFLKKQKGESKVKLEKFLDEGGNREDYKEEPDETTIKFDEFFTIYRKKRHTYRENLEKIKIQNLEAKKLILEELKALIESEETLKKTYDEFRVLQEKWKVTGNVPRAEVNTLWQNYHFYVEKFFDKVKINRELRDLDLKKNLEAKIHLCEKAEELLLETSIIKSFKELQNLHNEWKEIGPAPQDKKDEIWERFKTATDKINQRRRDHYLKLAEQQKANLIAKTELCEKSEEILGRDERSLKEWQEDTNNFSELLKIWKSFGPAPRKYNDDIWARFKNSLDTFFSAKKEFFNQIKDEQVNNYNQKVDLCIQAEGIKDSTDWRNTTRELIRLQQEWKNIGPVPRKNSDKIWKRFRAACDDFFNRKTEYFGNIDKHENENLKLKEELIKQVNNYSFGDNKNENLKALKDFQRQWTEIGHVPIKDKDRVQIDFREAINNRLDRLNISQVEIQTMQYKSRFENIGEQPNAHRVISNERNFLLNKKKKLEDDVNLWENNLGFLAQSKKADLLKQEFEKKIQKARQEIEVIAEKIKFLNKD